MKLFTEIHMAFAKLVKSL